MVVVTDVSETGGEETLRLIKHDGGQATFIATDVSQAPAVEALIHRIVETYGRLDCAHNNAGIEGPAVAFHEYPDDEWDRVLGINLKGVFVCMKAEIAHMLAQGGGAIVNTASVAGLVGIGQAAYTASKFGVVGLTKVAAMNYAQKGIRINAVCPGVIRTPMIERVIARSLDQGAGLLAIEPIGRFGTPEEIAAAVVWLCSDVASFVTGVAMPVDGGLVAR
jgi:NAD(P)-dependent dehydrogenase (short-subunit alcohol dehydrogenase family)